ncbi:protein kinase [bacterium]|nr:protein kinase [bacterium]
MKALSAGQTMNDTERIAEVVEEYLQLVRDGGHPDPHQFAERLPEQRGELLEILQTIAIIEASKRKRSAVASSQGLFDTMAQPPNIKDFRIVREIGRGGMGVVYEAWQESLHRFVGLKVLRVNKVDAPQAWNRFQQEVLAAAKLHHTNIVPVFGTGEADGCFFYAMQLIDGRSLNDVLTAYDTPNTNVGSVLEGIPDQQKDSVAYFDFVASIGSRIARAIDFAHRHGVIHRDIKPGNILLDRENTPWVTDFGLAKQRDAEDLTRTGEIVGTLRYLAPERFKGTSLPQGDIYSIGLTLRDLLCRRRVDLTEDLASAFERIRRGSHFSPRTIDSRIPRDLDTIIQKSTAYEVQDRYLTAEALADDLDRYLRREPVLARSAGIVLRWKRWAQRNPIVATLSMILIAVGCLGVTGVVWQWRRAEANRILAEQNFREAKLAVDQLLTSVSESKLIEIPGTQPLRRELLLSALSYYERFLSGRSFQPSLQRDVANAHYRVGIIQSELGESSSAKNAFEQAISEYGRLVEHSSNNLSDSQALAKCYARLGEVERRPNLNLAESHAASTQAIAIWSHLLHEFPSDVALQHEFASAKRQLATVLADIGRPHDALSELQAAERIDQSNVRQKPECDAYRYELSQVLFQKAELANSTKLSLPGAADAIEARDLLRQLVNQSPAVIPLQRDLGLALGAVAIAQYRARDLNNAVAAAEQCRQVFAKLAAENPDIIDFSIYLTQAEGLSAAAFAFQGKLPDALRVMKSATARIQRLMKRRPSDPFLQLLVIYLYDALSFTRPPFTLDQETYSAAIEILDRILEVPPGSSKMWALRAKCHASLHHWTEATNDLKQSMKAGNDDWPDQIRLCLLFMAEQDRQGYQQLCETILTRSQNESLNVATELMIAAIVLESGAVKDYSAVVSLARGFNERNPLSALHAICYGAALVRQDRAREGQGQLDRAEALLQATRALTPKESVEFLMGQTLLHRFRWEAFRVLGEENEAVESRKIASDYYDRWVKAMTADAAAGRLVPWEYHALSRSLQRGLPRTTVSP